MATNDDLFKFVHPEPQKKIYIPVEMPPMTSSMEIVQATFIVRDNDGETLAEGYVAIQTDPRASSERKVVMSRSMAEEILSNYLDSTGITMDDVRKAIDMLSGQIKE